LNDLPSPNQSVRLYTTYIITSIIHRGP